MASAIKHIDSGIITNFFCVGREYLTKGDHNVILMKAIYYVVRLEKILAYIQSTLFIDQIRQIIYINQDSDTLSDLNGMINVKEFISICQDFSTTITEAKAIKLFSEADTNKDGFIDLEEIKIIAQTY